MPCSPKRRKAVGSTTRLKLRPCSGPMRTGAPGRGPRTSDGRWTRVWPPPGSATALSKALGLAENRLRARDKTRFAGGIDFTFSPDQPIAALLILRRRGRLDGVYGLGDAHIGQVDWSLKPSSLVHALAACRMRPGRLGSHPSEDDVRAAMSSWTGSLYLGGSLLGLFLGAPSHSELGTATANDPSWLPLGLMPLFDPVFWEHWDWGHRNLYWWPDRSPVLEPPFDFPAAMWSPEAIGAAAALPPRLRWLYGCLALHRTGWRDAAAPAAARLVADNDHAVPEYVRRYFERETKLGELREMADGSSGAAHGPDHRLY